MHKKHLMFSFVLGLLLANYTVWSQQEKKPLTNADVVNMVKAELPESTIVLAIQQSPSSFDTSPDALIQLKQQGATAKILEAVLQAQAKNAGPTAKTSTQVLAQKTSWKVETQQFVFEVLRCLKTGKRVNCDLLVTNNGPDRDLWFRSPSHPPVTRMLDNFGNEYKVAEIQFGGKRERSLGTSLVSGVPVRATVIFDGVALEASQLTLLEIFCTIARPGYVGKTFSAQIHNVPLTTNDPTNSVISPSSATSNKDAITKATEYDFMFDLISCESSGGDSVVCAFTVTNSASTDRELWIYSNSRIIDETGTEYYATKTTLGNESNEIYDGLSSVLIPQVTTRASLKFEKVNPGATIIKVLRVSCGRKGSGIYIDKFNADFRNISLTGKPGTR